MDQIIMPRLGKIAKRETVLKDEKVFILTPDTDSGRIFGEQVKEKISPYTSRVTVLNDGSKDLFKESALFIVAGNLVNNPCVRYLYYKSYVITDLCYPVPRIRGTYPVRPLRERQKHSFYRFFRRRRISKSRPDLLGTDHLRYGTVFKNRLLYPIAGYG